MSVTTPAAQASVAIYGGGIGRGDLEAHVLQTLRSWIVAYLADYEREQGIPPRTLPIPPTPESFHGGLDFQTFSSDLTPELIVVCQPERTVERYGDGTYGAWFTVDVGAVCYVEGDQDRTRALADAYGTVLQKLLPQQGAFGFQADGVTDFATRTRLEEPYALSFVDESVRDIVLATTRVLTFLEALVVDYSGPRTPPTNPYAVPLPPSTANVVEVDLIRGTPDTSGLVTADGVELDGTVFPPVVRHRTHTVNEPPDRIPEPNE